MTPVAPWYKDLPHEWTEGCSSTVFDIARQEYESPGRYYHTWQHVEACLDALRTFPCDNPRAVFLALVFHDAVYVAGRSDNERLSAEFAVATLRERCAPGAGELAKVRRMILATQSHRDPQARTDADFGATLDIDMSILGADADRYTAYAQAVRREYCPGVVSEKRFTAGRIAFLSRVLASDAIFHTREGRLRWEQRARHNIARELAALRATQGPVWRVLTAVMAATKRK